MEITVKKSFTVIFYMNKNNNRILLNSNSEHYDLILTFGFSTGDAVSGGSHRSIRSPGGSENGRRHFPAIFLWIASPPRKVLGSWSGCEINR